MQAPEALITRLEPEIDRAIQRGLQDRLCFAAASVVSIEGVVVHGTTLGQRHKPPPLTRIFEPALFELGSLTEQFGVALAALWLVGKNRLQLQSRLGDILEACKNTVLQDITLDMLLDHTAGLSPDGPDMVALQRQDNRLHPSVRLLGKPEAQEVLLAAMKQLPLVAKSGESLVWSRLSPILLGWALEKVVKMPLERFLASTIYEPLDIAEELMFSPRGSFTAAVVSAAPDKIAPHDSLTQALGGVSGVGGLYATGRALWRLCQTLLSGYFGRHHFFHPGTIKRFWQRSKRVSTTRALGWDTPEALGAAHGKRLPRTCIGGVSDTGSAVWIDTAAQTVALLLIPATPPSPALHKWRAHVFDVMASFTAKGPPPADAAEALERIRKLKLARQAKLR